MIKIIVVSIALLFVVCSSRIEEQDITDQGKVSIGNNLYLKKITVGQDRIYFIVDQNDNLATGTVNTSFTEHTGKHTTVKSNSLITK